MVDIEAVPGTWVCGREEGAEEEAEAMVAGGCWEAGRPRIGSEEVGGAIMAGYMFAEGICNEKDYMKRVYPQSIV